MATAEQYAEWIVNNAHRRGTPEFDTVAQAYQLAKQEGLKTVPAPAPSKERTTGEAFSDIGAQLKGGLGKLAQFPGQLYGLATGDFSETGLYGYGKEVEAAAEAAKSPGLKAREAARAAAVAEAEKTGQLAAAKTAIGETITDPALALGLLAENLPSMLLPAGAAAGVGRVALQKGLAKGVEAAAAREAAIQAGKTAAIRAGAVQQGADVGTESYEQVYKRLVSQGVSEPEAAAQAINLARAAGVSGAIISLLAQRLPGASKLEEVLAGKTTTAGLGRAALSSAAGEALGEVPEEVGGRFTQNLALRTVDPTQSLTAGLGEAGGMAALAGAGLGGIGGGISSVRGKRALAEEEARKPQEAVEPQPAIAEAPKPVTGAAGIVRPEEETPISREVTKAAEPEVAPPAVISSSVPATKMPVTENYADMTVEALRSAKETADETNLQMDLSAIRKHFGEDAATAYAGMNRRQRNKWWDANATESFERDSSVFNGVNEETIDEYIQAYNKFDTESPQSLGRSIALIARKINDPDFIGSPEYLTLKNALSYAKEQGWSEKQVLDAMRGRASEWAGADAQELFKDLFKDVPKQTATTQTDSSLTKREELKALPPTVSPEPSIAKDRERAEPVVEAASPEPVVTEAEVAGMEEVLSAPEVVPQEEIARPIEPKLVQPKEPKTEIAEAPDTLTDEEFDQYEREQTQEAISRLSAGDYAAPRPATFVRSGMRSKVDEAMDRAKQNAYKKAVREFLQAPLTAKPPTGKSEGIDYSIYDAVDGLTDVEPQRIETKAPVAKSFQNKLEVLFKYVVPSKDIRYYLTRVMLDPEKSRMVATDGKSLVVVEDESVKQNAPERPLGVTRDKAILVDKDGTWATADDGRPMEAIYPDVDKVIPKTDRTDAVSYNTDDFVAYAKGVEKSNKFVKKDLPLVLQIYNKQNAFDVERLVSLGEIFRRLGYKNFVVTLPNDPLDGRLMATSPDGKVKQIVMSRKYGETTGEIKRRFYKPYEPVAPKARVQPEGEGRAVGSDEEVKKSLRATPAQQVSDFGQTLRTALNKFGLKDVGVKLIDGMREEGSYAQQLIRIAADSANPIRTLRHEAIHALRELGFFTPQQWQSLSKMAKDKWIDQYLKQRNVDGKPLKAGEESRYDAYMREYEGDMEKITEEAVADAFADFDATKPPSGLMSSLLTRLRNLFQAIKSALTKVESPEQIFGKVERGELAAGRAETKGEAKSLRDRATANFLRWFGNSKVVDEKGEPLVVYHGTASDFTEFDFNRLGDNTRKESGELGFFFTSKTYLSDSYADIASRGGWAGKTAAGSPVIYPVYLTIKNPKRYDTASAFYRNADIYKGRLNEWRAKLQSQGFDGVIVRDDFEEVIAFRPEQIKSATGNNGEYSLTDADIRKSLRKSGEPSPTTAGQSALDTINQLGMGVQPPEPGKIEKIKNTLKNIGENPSLTVQEAKKKFGEWMDWFDTKAFSADAKFEADVRRGLKEDMAGMEALIGTMLSVSQSGAVHADAVATQAVLKGRAEYDPETQKWVAVDDKNNITELSRQLEAIAEKYGLTKEEAQRVAHTYFVAKNYNGILERNKKTQAQIDSLKEEGKKEEADDLKDTLIFVTPDQKALVEPGLELINQIPELGKMVETWNNIRQNFVKTLVDSYLWSPEYATAMLDNIDYVPFYREEQVQEEEGPQQMIRGLQVKSKEHKLKGSASPVNDVFDNMARWMQYAMNRAIRNHKALQMVDVATEMKVGDRMMAKKVSEPKRGMNVARVWRGGKQEFYDMADPLYVGAFQSLGAVSIPSIKFFTDISNILRKTVVMYPLFSIGQITQDSVAAIFASGLKPQHAFKIPYLAVKEFGKTMMGWSTTHDELVKYGVVGVRDFNATVARQDAEITAGIKAPRGAWGKVNYMLERVAMSADNAVRQAMYIAATEAKLSKAEALEKAFEIINFRRRGSSKLLNLMGQTVPFFYAYLSAQRVAYKTLTGTGISPTERKAALETLAQTTAAVMALSFIYAMANGDDEEYKKTPSTIRDRSLMIPGSGGVRIPLRPDFFLFPKVIAEHTYQLLTDEGYSDGAKMRKSMADLLANATLSPNAVPQIIKPTFEAAINYSFFEGKPIVGFFEQNKEAGRQFNESTSEFAKWLGRFGASPQMVDHLVRGYFGSVGGLGLWGTNFFIEGEPGVPRPEITAHDMFVTMPGVGAFKQKPTENALKVDFYELRDAIAKVKNTYDDMKVRSPEGLEAFIQDEKNLARLAMDKQITKIGDHLSKIRRAVQQVAAAPESRMSASEKQERIKELRDVEMDLLKAVDVKALRAQAKL